MAMDGAAGSHIVSVARLSPPTAIAAVVADATTAVVAAANDAGTTAVVSELEQDLQ